MTSKKGPFDSTSIFHFTTFCGSSVEESCVNLDQPAFGFYFSRRTDLLRSKPVKLPFYWRFRYATCIGASFTLVVPVPDIGTSVTASVPFSFSFPGSGRRGGRSLEDSSIVQRKGLYKTIESYMGRLGGVEIFLPSDINPLVPKLPKKSANLLSLTFPGLICKGNGRI